MNDNTNIYIFLMVALAVIMILLTGCAVDPAPVLTVTPELPSPTVIVSPEIQPTDFPNCDGEWVWDDEVMDFRCWPTPEPL